MKIIKFIIIQNVRVCVFWVVGRVDEIIMCLSVRANDLQFAIVESIFLGKTFAVCHK